MTKADLLPRFARYLQKHFAFRQRVATLTDTRRGAQISTATVWLSLFAGLACRRPSLHSLEAELRLPKRWEAWVGPRKPSADTCAYALARWELGPLRRFTWAVVKVMKRAKMLTPPPWAQGLWVAAVDGHELWASRKRCCDACLTRTHETKTGPVTEYYHRVVVCQLVGVTPPVVLDLELVRPGEQEVKAATRLLTRLLAAFPTCADVFTVDALYFDASFVQPLRQQGKHAVIVLKEDRLLLSQDVDGLLPLTLAVPLAAGPTTGQLWDLPELTSWESLGTPVRVVCAAETTTTRQRLARAWQRVTTSHTWRWVATLPPAVATALTVWHIGHARWDVEERGFNEWVTHWGFDHCFTHQPVAITAILLTLTLAHALTVVFWTRALKPALTQGKTRLWLALRFAEDLVRLGGTPVWAEPP